jgi:hypothetical protein
MSSPKHLFVWLFLAIFCVPAFAQQSSSSGQAGDPALMKILQQELDRAMTSLSKADPAPYFISYAAGDDVSTVIAGSNGALLANINRHDRNVDISVRVGGRDLDNTHGENRMS